MEDGDVRFQNRRSVLKRLAGGLAGGVGLAASAGRSSASSLPRGRVAGGRIKQSVCRWCFQSISLERLAREAAMMGLRSIELVPPKDWPVLKRYGLICAMTPSHSLFEGLNRTDYHQTCVAEIRAAVDASAEAGFPNVVVLSGFREGLSDEEGLANTVKGLKKVIGHAEKKGVTLCLEMINSRVDGEMKGRPGYMCDTVEWAVSVCERIGSPRMKILFDIYHVQIMQGDLITRIREYKDHIAHFHTGGVPGRNEIDSTQEINYPAVLRTIAELGFDGYVAHEFIPIRDPLQSLAEAVELCDVV